MREPYPNELMHYGVLGMKWGIRRYQNPDGTLTAAGKKRYGSVENLERGMTIKQANKQARLDRISLYKNRRSVDIDTINKEIERYKKEKELKSITDEDLNPGKKFVQDLLSSSFAKVASVAAVGTMAYLANYGLNRLGDPDFKIDYKKLAEYVAPNPNKKK